MDEEKKNENIVEENQELEEENSEETTEDVSEENEQTFDEEKYADYARDDIIEMLRSQRDSISEIKAAIDGIKDIVAVFVENGGTVREDVLIDENPIVEEDFGLDNIDIDDLDLSL